MSEVSSSGTVARIRRRHGSASHSKRRRTSFSEDSPHCPSQEEDFTSGQHSPGILQKLHVRNFMCYSCLDFDFNHNVNIIGGDNGSGKSSIVTAIIVGLGGKAAVTSRGSSVKSFIKHGKTSASIELHLFNGGPDGYKLTEYGQKIIICRTINANGSSLYKVKSSNGKIVSEKKEEIDRILAVHNIQVDNPVAVLNQDTARNFLNSSEPKDKYSFFLKATQLEKLDQDYCLADEQKRVSKDIITERKEALPVIENEVAKWEQKWQWHRSVDRLRNRVQDLKNEMAWALVAEEETNLQSLEVVLEKEQKKTPKFVQKVQELQKNETDLKARYKEVQKQLNEVAEEITALEDSVKYSKENLRVKKDAYKKEMLRLKAIQKEGLQIKCDRDHLQKEIRKLRNTVQSDYAEKKEERKRKIASLQEKLSSLEAKKKTNDHHKEQIKGTVTKYKEEQYGLKAEKQDIERQINQKQRHLQSLVNQRENSLTLFGSWVPSVLEKVKQAYSQKKFKHMPRGPIGSHIKLKDASWAPAIEATLSRLLRSFCVDNQSDARILNNILHQELKTERKPDIIASEFFDRMHDVRQHAVSSEQYPSMLDMLEIDDVVTANCLIDQKQVETILLLPSNKEAYYIMSEASRVPQNCRLAITPDGNTYYPDPNYKSYAGDPKKKAELLQVSIEDIIRNTQDEITELKKKDYIVREKLDNLTKELQMNIREMSVVDGHIMRIRQDIQKTNAEVIELNNVVEPDPVDVTSLEEDLKNFNAELDKSGSKERELKEICEKMKEEVEEAEKEVKIASDNHAKAFGEKMDPLKDELGHIEEEVQKLQLYRKHYESKKKGHMAVLHGLEKDVQKKQKEVRISTAKATKLCAERIDSLRMPRTIENEIDSIQKNLAKEELERGTREEVTRTYYETKKKCDIIKHEIEMMENSLKKLDDMVETRRERYIQFRQTISLRVQYLFQAILCQKQFTGTMKFDHGNKELYINVNPHAGSKNVNRNMKGLSGGEKSFSTVSFILSFWDVIDAPFRVLDEFDVFMDMVNRRISMDLLLESALGRSQCQFIFLTPLEISSVKAGLHLQIHRMPSPERTNKNQDDEEDEGS